MVSRRRIWVRRLGALAACGGVAVAAAAAAFALKGPSSWPADDGIDGYSYTGDGWPWLEGNISEPGAKGRTWQRCAPECGAVLSRKEFYEAGPTPAGARFRLAAPDGDKVYESFTPTWHGQLRNVEPPTLKGVARVGSVLVPTRGRWTGGWQRWIGDEKTMIGLRACPTPAGQDCVAMTPSIIQPGNHASVRIRPSYAGWYVGAVERVSGTESWTMEGHIQAPDLEQARPAPSPGGNIAASKLIGPVR